MWQMYHHSVTEFIHNSVLVCLFVCVCVSKESVWYTKESRHMEGNKVRPWVESNLDIFQALWRTYFILSLWTLPTLTFFISRCKTTPRCVCVCMHLCTLYLLFQRKMNIKDDFCHSQTDVFLTETLAAWLSTHYHVLIWNVNHPCCISSPCSLTVSGVELWGVSFLGYFVAKDSTVHYVRQSHSII